MPIPFILGAIAISAGLFGVKKGFDAKSDFDRAGELDNEARWIFEEAKSALEKAHRKAKNRMENCGKKKFDIYKEVIIPFWRSARKIKNIELNEISIDSDMPPMTEKELQELGELSIRMEEVVAGGVGALGAGGLAGLAAYGGTMAFATASTGTAIGALSGVAATNATLAWLGGGSLAAGGFGMAGGAMVLGGIVAAPVLAIGGMFMAARAETAKENAYANRDLAKKNAEEMKIAETAVDAIGGRFEQLSSLLERLHLLLESTFKDFQNLVEVKNDYSKFSQEQKALVGKTFTGIKVIKSVLDVPVLTEKGELTRGSARTLTEAESFSDQIAS